ncbi:hypothetical protein, partial [Escherichia coli]|uniref:hypothetical protein n=1 Tax=Escherichia coli TaxID=562 RepID=UPI003EDF85A0
MRISNIEWLKKRIGFIRKLGEQTARQRQIIDLNGLNHRHVDFLWDSEHGQHRRKITHAPVIGGASATYRNGAT